VSTSERDEPTVSPEQRRTTDDPTLAQGDAAPDGHPPALLDDPAVVAAISAHADAEVALVEAKHVLTRARAAVRDALFEAGTRYRDRQLPLPRGDLHRLYWEHRELRVTDLANAFGVNSTELARLAGPTEGYGRCDDCQQVVPMLLDNRNPKPSYASTPPVRCDACRERHDEQQERERQRQHELDLARVAAGEPVDRDRALIHVRSRYDGPGW
jgi:AraC-like DNA-binding protein